MVPLSENSPGMSLYNYVAFFSFSSVIATFDVGSYSFYISNVLIVLISGDLRKRYPSFTLSLNWDTSSYHPWID